MTQLINLFVDVAIFLNVGGEVEDRGQVDELNDPHRNLCSVAFPPEGEAWFTSFTCNGETRVMASGIGVASASASALPGDLLYGVKLGIEETRLVFSQNPVSDAELLIEFANRRVDEVIMLTEAKRASDVEQALTGYEDIISRIIKSNPRE